MPLQTVLDLLERGEIDAAITQCQTLVQQTPTDAECVHLLGLLYAKSGEINLAIKYFKNAIDLDPKQAIFHNNISNAYKIIGELEQASRHLNAALTIAPNNAESFNNLGSLYYTQGDIKRAIQQFEKAIRLNPQSFEAHYNLANCYIKRDMVLQAISHYQTVLKLNPSHSNAQLNLAMSYVMVNDYANALPFLEEIITYDPEHKELQGHIAEAYLNLGMTDKALNHYIKAVNLDPNRPAWQHNLAVLYLRNNQKDLAKLHFKLAIKLQPDNSTAQHMLASLEEDLDTKQAPAEYVKLLFDQYSGHYNEHMTNDLKYNAPQLLRQAVNKFITPHTPQQMILDLGCGTGLCGIYFRDLARFFVGVDISPAMLLEAHKLGAYDALCCCNILEAVPGLHQQYFDIILAADVFVYIGALEDLFSMLSSSLKPGGMLCFTIEEQDKNPTFLLQTSGRFAHNAQYIDSICAKHGFTLAINDSITPRIQNNVAIAGRLYILTKN